ncbi:ABC transporter ATP-binding protein [Aliarcobacter butzleri]|uniref:ABC transporter ATP-binding protein n=1 Tax=Aliarcobacter butzleri TaxID=28197 RepID=UPI003B21EC03
MLKVIKELFALLTPAQRKRFFILQILVIFMTFGEILGIASIAPFMALVSDIDILQRDNILTMFYQQTGFIDPYNFVFFLGVCVIVFLTLASILSMLTTWKLLMFSSSVGTEIADRLYSYYLKQPWLFHANGSSAQLTKQVSSESIRVTDSIITPLMVMNAKLVFSIVLSIIMFIYNPIVALAGIVIFSLAYLILYKIVKKRLQENGRNISTLSTERFGLMNEGFGGIKDILLLGKSEYFVNRFTKSSVKFAYARGNSMVLGQVPKFFIELLAFASMLSLVLYLLIANKNNLTMILPILSVYALTGFKLLPAFQQIYSSISSIKANIAAFEAIRDDLVATKKLSNNIEQIEIKDKIIPNESIELKDVSFIYPNKNIKALDCINMSIKANSIVGIVGHSGSGKSTAIDILLGLISPQKGQLKVDGKTITEINLRTWQNSIGFVPQSIFISECTIAQNVAFGISEENIDINKVKQALKLAHLEELVNDMPNGIDTKVGERGVQLSGGQRQRIGIARALYNDASLLVFDEATSALDGITEKMIMQAIHDFTGKKTIVMIAHRLKTVEKCDIIYFMEKGKVVDSGTYIELVEKNHKFRKMAKYS